MEKIKICQANSESLESQWNDKKFVDEKFLVYGAENFEANG